jgi:CRISPR system Cascade subunit CasB
MVVKMTEKEEDVYGFVSKAIRILEQESPGRDNPWSRAMLAKLRRGAGKPPGAVPEVWEITLSEMPEQWRSYRGNPSYQENAVHTALTLYALHRQGKDKSVSAKKVSLGGAAAQLIDDQRGNEDTVRRRFNIVATAVEFNELAYHARGLIQLLRAKDISLDYSRFAQDLLEYQRTGGAERVRLRWGEDFYRVTGKTRGKDDE